MFIKSIDPNYQGFVKLIQFFCSLCYIFFYMTSLKKQKKCLKIMVQLIHKQFKQNISPAKLNHITLTNSQLHEDHSQGSLQPKNNFERSCDRFINQKYNPEWSKHLMPFNKLRQLKQQKNNVSAIQIAKFKAEDIIPERMTPTFNYKKMRKGPRTSQKMSQLTKKNSMFEDFASIIPSISEGSKSTSFFKIHNIKPETAMGTKLQINFSPQTESNAYKQFCFKEVSNNNNRTSGFCTSTQKHRVKQVRKHTKQNCEKVQPWQNINTSELRIEVF